MESDTYYFNIHLRGTFDNHLLYQFYLNRLGQHYLNIFTEECCRTFNLIGVYTINNYNNNEIYNILYNNTKFIYKYILHTHINIHSTTAYIIYVCNIYVCTMYYVNNNKKIIIIIIIIIIK